MRKCVSGMKKCWTHHILAEWISAMREKMNRKLITSALQIWRKSVQRIHMYLTGERRCQGFFMIMIKVRHSLRRHLAY